MLRDVVLDRRHFYWNLHDLLNDLLDDLRHLYNPLDDSRDNDYLLYDSFDLYAFGHLYDLLNYFFLDCWHFLDLLEVDLLRDYFFLAH